MIYILNGQLSKEEAGDVMKKKEDTIFELSSSEDVAGDKKIRLYGSLASVMSRALAVMYNKEALKAKQSEETEVSTAIESAAQDEQITAAMVEAVANHRASDRDLFMLHVNDVDPSMVCTVADDIARLATDAGHSVHILGYNESALSNRQEGLIGNLKCISNGRGGRVFGGYHDYVGDLEIRQ